MNIMYHFWRSLTKEEIKRKKEETKRLQREKTNNTIEGIVISSIRDNVYSRLKKSTQKVIDKGMAGGWGEEATPIYSLYKKDQILLLFGSEHAYSVYNNEFLVRYVDPNFEDIIVDYIEHTCQEGGNT